MSAAYTVPLFLRGEVITDNLIAFGTRRGAAQFEAPDMSKYVDQLPLKSPGDMADLYALSFDEILDVLEALGNALDFDTNTQAGTDSSGQPVTFAQIYNWMGETAREQVFDVLKGVNIIFGILDVFVLKFISKVFL